MLKGSVSAVIVAGGAGKRMGVGMPKAFIKIAGKAMFLYSAELLSSFPEILEIIVVVPAGWETRAEGLLQGQIKRPFRVVIGGRERIASSRNGVLATSDKSAYVLIHDAARPFITSADIRRILSACAKWRAVIPGIPAVNTLKRAGKNGLVAETLDRGRVYEIQTPQIFRRADIIRGFKKAWGLKGGLKRWTDDSMLAELVNVPIKIIRGSSSNIKITIKEDMPVAAKTARCKKKY